MPKQTQIIQIASIQNEDPNRFTPRQRCVQNCFEYDITTYNLECKDFACCVQYCLINDASGAGRTANLVNNIEKYIECVKNYMDQYDRTHPQPNVTPPCKYPNPQTPTGDSSRDFLCEVWAASRKIKAGVVSAQCSKHYDPNAPGQRFPPYPLPRTPPTKFTL